VTDAEVSGTRKKLSEESTAHAQENCTSFWYEKLDRVSPILMLIQGLGELHVLVSEWRC